MHRGKGRMPLPEVIARQSQLDPVEQTNSASVARAEREIKQLKLENYKLKSDLTDLRSTYNQLIRENSHEKFDERRVTLLKSQVIQLERQLLVLSEALSSRGEVLLEVENSLAWLADQCRAYICMEIRGPQVNVDRSSLTQMVETAESARIKLYKQLENKTTERLSQRLNFYTEFIHPSRGGEITLLEVAGGSLEHLNLKHVTKLETKLSNLYKELIQLHSCLEVESSGDSACLWTSGHVTLAARERLMTQLLKSCAQMKDCSSDLLDLSLLLPSAPWPPLKKNALKEITAERVLSSLPNFPRSKSGEAHSLIQALVKAYNYKVFMLTNENKTLREEMKYHQNVYNLQLKYTESLFQAIREGYSSFEETSNELLVKPLKAILDRYVQLNRTASEASLKVFLSTFKDHATQLNDIVETIEPKAFQESEGSQTLSQYGDEFFQSLEKLVKEQQTKRDREVSRHDGIRSEQDRLDQELKKILTEQEVRMGGSLITSTGDDVTQDISGLHDTSNRSTENIYNDDNSTSRFHEGNATSRFHEQSDSINATSRFHEQSDSILSDNNKQVGFTSTSDNQKVESGNYERERSVLKTSPKTSRRKSKGGRVVHQKEWVDVVDVKQSMAEMALNDEVAQELTDRELHELHYHKDVEDDEAHYNAEAQYRFRDDTGLTLDSPTLSEKPPQSSKVKKKRNYVPNTFVPNRTLQLRRSGSLSRLSTTDHGMGECATEDQLQSDRLDMRRESSDNAGKAFNQVRSGRTQTSGSKQKLPKSKPAFR